MHWIRLQHVLFCKWNFFTLPLPIFNVNLKWIVKDYNWPMQRRVKLPYPLSSAVIMINYSPLWQCSVKCFSVYNMILSLCSNSWQLYNYTNLKLCDHYQWYIEVVAFIHNEFSEMQMFFLNRRKSVREVYKWFTFILVFHRQWKFFYFSVWFRIYSAFSEKILERSVPKTACILSCSCHLYLNSVLCTS